MRKQTNNANKHNSTLSNTCRHLGNTVYTKAIKEPKDFTIKMCKNINNKLFYVKKLNRYGVSGRALEKTKKINIIKTVNGVNFVDGFIDDEGTYHPIEGQEKIKIPSEDTEEFTMAFWIKDNLGGEINMVPRIEKIEGNKNKSVPATPDYIWNNEKWDLKGIDGNSKYTIGHKFEDYKNQTNNLILFSRKTNMTDEEIIIYITKSFEKYTKYYNKVIYMRDYRIIKIFKR